MKKVNQIEMHYPDGSFYNVYELYKWLGKIDTSSAGHKFEIEVKIIEYKEDEK